MRIVSIVSTKGGPGKTTVTANLGAFCADANVRTLLIDLDTQPSLSSFYRLGHEILAVYQTLICLLGSRQIMAISYIPWAGQIIALKSSHWMTTRNDNEYRYQVVCDS
nr:ParA family protein [Pseudomonas cichorii]